MNICLSRVCALRHIVRAKVENGKRSWRCSEGRVRVRVGVGQRRAYGDDAIRAPFGPFGTVRRERRHEPEMAPARHAGRGEEKAQVFTPFSHPVRSAERVELATNAHDGEAQPTTQTEDEAESAESVQAALWERFEQYDDQAPSDARPRRINISDEFVVDAVGVDNATISTQNDPSLFDLDYAALLPEALQNRNMDLLARCLYAAARVNDMEFIQSITPDEFSTVLTILEPANSIDKLASAHLEISAAMAQQFGLASMEKIAWEYARIVKQIVAMRKMAGSLLAFADYATLLRSARDLGDPKLASQFWDQMLKEGHLPKTELWNYYMAGAVFHRAHNAQTRYKLRVIPFNMVARQSSRLGPPYIGYRVGKGGIKSIVIDLFNKMLKDGVAADEESFRIIITAAAREGEIGTVKTILRKVWSIDVDALLSGQDQADLAPKRFPMDSPLRPTSKLLFVLAHAFGINNDIPTALRLVDFVARSYDLVISQETWSQLFEWTFVLAVPRTGKKDQANRIGQLPKRSVMDLWTTMTGPPYSIQPTMGMYHRLIKSLFYRNLTPSILEKMEEGRQLYIQSRQHAKCLWKSLQRELAIRRHYLNLRSDNLTNLRALYPDHMPPPASDAALDALTREWEYADLLRRRNIWWLKKWLNLLLGTMRSQASYDISEDWALRHIPTLLWEWRVFAKTKVRYETIGGILEFQIRTEEDIERDAVERVRRKLDENKILNQIPRLVGKEWVRNPSRIVPNRLRGRLEEIARQSGAPSGSAEGILRRVLEETEVNERMQEPGKQLRALDAGLGVEVVLDLEKDVGLETYARRYVRNEIGYDDLVDGDVEGVRRCGQDVY